jgi:hypothetical protein
MGSLLAVAGGQNYWEAWTQLRDPTGKFNPGHPRHDDVRKDNVDLVLRKSRKRVVSRCRAKHVASKINEEIIGERSDLRIVLDQQYPDAVF